MDTVTTAILSAIILGLNTLAIDTALATDTAKDAYKTAKHLIKKKLGISSAIDELEANPESKQCQTRLIEELGVKKAAADPELIELAHRLIEAIKETEAGRKSLGKYNIEAQGAQVGIIGDGNRVQGGIHFHNDGGVGGSASQSSPSANETDAREPEEPGAVLMNILHLSDLHFGVKEDAHRWYGQLAEDLKRNLCCEQLDAMIITGDVANTAVLAEYDAARIFIERVCVEFKIPSSSIAIVPGNHDMNRDLSEDAYSPVKRKKLTGKLEEGNYIDESDSVIQSRDDSVYGKRFLPFSDFYHKITGKIYPIAHEQQGIIYHFEELDLLILGLNSAWRVDHHYRNRAAICPDALSAALDTIRQNPDYDNCPNKFAMWHHPINSSFEDRIIDHGFLERLAQTGFSICFHGHLHKTITQLFPYDKSPNDRKIEIVGGGTFGAPTKEWYSGYPLQYQLLKVTNKQLIVETRYRTELYGPWNPHAIWNQGQGQDPLPRYTIDLVQRQTTKPKANEPPTQVQLKEPLATDQSLEADIHAYCEKVRSLYEYLPLIGFSTKLRVPMRIADIYEPLMAMVDLRSTGSACFADSFDVEEKLGHNRANTDIALVEAFSRSSDLERRGIVILGDPGSGKTTHLKRLLLWCLQQRPDELKLPADIIPVYLPLRELRDLTQGLDAFIQGQLDNPHLGTSAGFGKRLVGRGNLLFLLDGLDEVADSDQRARVARWIDEAVIVHRSCRFVVTCRFAGYTDKARLCEQFLEIHLRPFSFDKVKAFVRKWYRIVEKGLSNDAKQAEVIANDKSQDLIDRLDNPDFRVRRVFNLTFNPLLLTNICLVHRDRGNLPQRRDRLYEECTDVLLELWRTAIGYQTKVDVRSGRQVLQPVALWMHQKEGRTRARVDELAPVIGPALKSAGWPYGKAEDFLRVVRDESGLLTCWDHEHYGFMHLGFQEYLAALEIQNKCLLDPLILSNLADQFGQSWWQEVILLLLSLNNPCPFVPFMRFLIHKPGFIQHPEMLEMCLDDAAEKSVLPFMELLQEKPGEDPDCWQRQLAALKLVERLDNEALNGLIEQLARHPYEKIRERVIQRTAKAEQKVISASRGGYELVWIRGGELLMGSPDSEEGRYDDEEPQHLVQLSEFYMGRHPVTNEEYGRFLAENPKEREPENWARREYNQPQQPVTGVSWEDARQYAKWAGLQLPSEAQWEYACRAGTRTRYYSGDTDKDLDQVGWYSENSGGMLHPVGAKEPNGFGLYDMHGNVWEWVEDDWHKNYNGAPEDGSAWIDESRGSNRVIRGGSWDNSARLCRAAARDGGVLGDRGGHLGFRLALLPGQ